MNTNTHHTGNIHHTTIPQGLGRKQATFRSRPSTRFIVVFCVMIAYAAVLIWFLVKGYRVTPGLPFLALSIYGQRLGRQTRLVRVHERGLCFGTVDALQPVAFSSIANVWLSSPTAVDMTLVDGRTMPLTVNLTRAAQLVAAVQAALAPQQAWGWPTVSSWPAAAPTTHRWAPPTVGAMPAAATFVPPSAPQPVAMSSSPLATTSTGGRSAVLVVLVVALVAGIGLGARSLVASDPVAAVADRSTDSADESGATDATEATELVATTAPTVESTVTTAPPFTLPPTTTPGTTTPGTTVAPETTVPAHQLAGLQVGQCLDANNSIVGCVRGAQVVTAVSPAAGLTCNSGETLLEVSQTPAVPATVSACLLPWYLDDRSLEQVFEIDPSCAVPPSSERSAFEVELLKCLSSSGSAYYLVKVQEAQIADYLREVLVASFLGDWSTTDGAVCGGHFQSAGWDVYVYGNGPFVEYRQLDDSEGVSFSRSLCVA